MSEKLKQSDIYRAVADAINQKSYSMLEPFKKRFVVVERAEGIRQVMRVTEDEICKPVDSEAVVSAILNYVDSNPHTMDNEYYKFTYKQARDCMQRWLASAPVVSEPALVRFKDEPGLTYSRLPWRFSTEGSCPLFDEIFSRMTNAHAAMDFIGSIFEPASYNQNYLYLCGEGQNGKGTLVTFLCKALGQAATSLDVPVDSFGNLKDQFFFSDVYDKRLVVFDDIQLLNFPASGTFKKLTGHSFAHVNQKYGKKFSAIISLKVIITANDLPVLPGDRASRRRIILCPIDDANPEMSPTDYEEAIWQEGGIFLSRCIENYRTKYPSHESIEVDTSEFDLLAEQEGRPHERLFERLFEYTGEEGDILPAHQFFDALSDSGFGSVQVNKFKRWLARTHKVRLKKHTLSDGSRKSGYQGLKQKLFVPDASRGTGRGITHWYD